MFLVARIATQPKMSGGLLCQVILLAYLAMLAHEYAPDHIETDTGCSICITKDRADDAATGAGNYLLVGFTRPQLLSTTSRPDISTDVPVAASRGPPLRS